MKTSFDESIGFLLADVSRLLRREFDRRVRQLGLTQAQWRAIAHLAREEGINQSALAERLEVAAITLGRLVDRMEAAGWVRREADASDRRASLLFLTPKAAPILDELQAHADQARAVLMQGISDSRHRQLIATLQQMKANLASAAETCDHEQETRHG